MATKPILVDLDFGSSAKATGLPAPTASSDAANKDYVDNALDSVTINTQSGATYTLVPTDNNNIVDLTNPSTKTATVDTFANQAIPSGGFGIVSNKGAGLATFAVVSGVTLNGVAGPANFTFVQNERVYWVKTGINTVEAFTYLSSGAGTDLTYVASTRILSSSTGADVTLPLATITAPGLAERVAPGPSRYYSFIEGFSATNGQEWTVAVAGTGSSFSSITPQNSNGIGWLRHAMGTVATNRGAIHCPSFTTMRLDVGAANWTAKIRKPVLSDATNTYSERSGFIDNVSGESVDGVFFRYTHSVNGGRWEAVTRSNNVQTAQDTGITVAINTDYKLEIKVNATGTSAEFYINGTLTNTITTNIPIGTGREVGYGHMALRTVGTATFNSMDIDYLMVEQTFTSR